MWNTQVPLIFLSDETHLSNCDGNKKEGPVDFTIGNLFSKIRQMPWTESVIMVALLPILNKNTNIPPMRLDEQGQMNQEVLNQIISRVLHPITFEQSPRAESGYY